MEIQNLHYGEIGTNLKKARLRRDWSLQDVSDKLVRFFGIRVGKSSISKYERNKIKISPNVFHALCHLYGVQASDIAGFAFTNARTIPVFYTLDQSEPIINGKYKCGDIVTERTDVSFAFSVGDNSMTSAGIPENGNALIRNVDSFHSDMVIAFSIDKARPFVRRLIVNEDSWELVSYPRHSWDDIVVPLKELKQRIFVFGEVVEVRIDIEPPTLF